MRLQDGIVGLPDGILRLGRQVRGYYVPRSDDQVERGRLAPIHKFKNELVDIPFRVGRNGNQLDIAQPNIGPFGIYCRAGLQQSSVGARLSGGDGPFVVENLPKSDTGKRNRPKDESGGGEEKQPSIFSKIASQLHRFTIEFGLFLLGYN